MEQDSNNEMDIEKEKLNQVVLESAKEIKERRTTTLSNYEFLKKKANDRKRGLKDNKNYLLFAKDAQYILNWIELELEKMVDQELGNITETQSRINQHHYLEMELANYVANIKNLDDFGKEMLKTNHFKSSEIKPTLEKVHLNYDRLKELVKCKNLKLAFEYGYLQWICSVDSILNWCRNFYTDEKRNEIENSDINDYLLSYLSDTLQFVNITGQENELTIKNCISKLTEFDKEYTSQINLKSEALKRCASILADNENNCCSQNVPKDVIDEKTVKLEKCMSIVRFILDNVRNRLGCRFDYLEYKKKVDDVNERISEKRQQVISEIKIDTIVECQNNTCRNNLLKQVLDGLVVKVTNLIQEKSELISKYPNLDEIKECNINNESLMSLWKLKSVLLEQNIKYHRLILSHQESMTWLSELQKSMTDLQMQEPDDGEVKMTKIFINKLGVYGDELQARKCIINKDEETLNGLKKCFGLDCEGTIKRQDCYELSNIFDSTFEKLTQMVQNTLKLNSMYDETFDKWVQLNDFYNTKLKIFSFMEDSKMIVVWVDLKVSEFEKHVSNVVVDNSESCENEMELISMWQEFNDIPQPVYQNLKKISLELKEKNVDKIESIESKLLEIENGLMNLTNLYSDRLDFLKINLKIVNFGIEYDILRDWFNIKSNYFDTEKISFKTKNLRILSEKNQSFKMELQANYEKILDLKSTQKLIENNGDNSVSDNGTDIRPSKNMGALNDCLVLPNECVDEQKNFDIAVFDQNQIIDLPEFDNVNYTSLDAAMFVIKLEDKWKDFVIKCKILEKIINSSLSHQQYLRKFTELAQWIDETNVKIENREGEDVSTVEDLKIGNTLLINYVNLENEIDAYQCTVDDLSECLDLLKEKSINIEIEQLDQDFVNLKEKYDALKTKLRAKKEGVEKCVNIQNYCNNIETNIDWLKSRNNFIVDKIENFDQVTCVADVEKLQKYCDLFELELENRQVYLDDDGKGKNYKKFTDVFKFKSDQKTRGPQKTDENGQVEIEEDVIVPSMIDPVESSNFQVIGTDGDADPVIKSKVDNLSETWSKLKNTIGDKRKNLASAKESYRFNEDCDCAIDWLNEKKNDFSNSKSVGVDEDEVEYLDQMNKRLEKCLLVFKKDWISKLDDKISKLNSNFQISSYKIPKDLKSDFIILEAVCDYDSFGDNNVAVFKGNFYNILDGSTTIDESGLVKSENDAIDFVKVESLDKEMKGYVPIKCFNPSRVGKFIKAKLQPKIWKISLNDKLNYVHSLYNEMNLKYKCKGEKLKNFSEAYAILRDVENTQKSIKDKYSEIQKYIEFDDGSKSRDSVKSDMENQRHLETLKNDILVVKQKVDDINEKKEPIKEIQINNVSVESAVADLNNEWKVLEGMAHEHMKNVGSENELNDFVRDVDEILTWINQKTSYINNVSNNVGDDYPSVQKLLRKHDGFGKDLSAVYDKYKKCKITGEIVSEHESKNKVFVDEKINLISNKLEKLKCINDDRKITLTRSENYQKYLRDYNYMINNMTEISNMFTKEIAVDVCHAENLIEIHMEQKISIDSILNFFKKLVDMGLELMKNQQDRRDEISETVTNLKNMNESLQKDWSTKKFNLENRLEFCTYERDVNQINAWMEKQENLIENNAKCAADQDLEIVQRAFDDLSKSMSLKQKKIEALYDTSNRLISNCKNLSESLNLSFEGNDQLGSSQLDNENKKLIDEFVDNVSEKQKNLLEHWQKLRSSMLDHKENVAIVEQIHLWFSNYDDMVCWISDKEQVLNSIETLDLDSAAQKFKKHNCSIEEILQQNGISKLKDFSEKLFAKNLYPEKKQFIDGKIFHLQGKYDILCDTSRGIIDKLKFQVQVENLTGQINEIKFWLDETEESLNVAVMDLYYSNAFKVFKKQILLNADILSYKDRINLLVKNCNEIYDINKDESTEIKDVISSILDKYHNICEMSENQKKNLDQCKNVHLLICNIIDENARLSNIYATLSQENYCKDVSAAQNMIKKHKIIHSEIDNKKETLDKFNDELNQYDDKVLNPETNTLIVDLISKIDNEYEKCLTAFEERNETLKKSLEIQNILVNISEERSWYNSKINIMSSMDFGDSITSVQAMLKKHETFFNDFATHSDKSKKLSDSIQDVVSNDELVEAIHLLNTDLNQLKKLASNRYETLKNGYMFYQFLWKSDLIEEWIKEKMAHINSNEKFNDFYSIELEIHKQESIILTIETFERDNMSSLREMYTKFADGEYGNLDKVNIRFDEITNLWKDLVKISDDRKKFLYTNKRQFTKLDQLYLSFAKRASAFNSGFENAEEDLTDPVTCNSIEEVNLLVENHKQFESSLVEAKDDYAKMLDIDQKIAKISDAANPYTWFTINYFKNAWSNLNSSITGRTNDLKSEMERQKVNDNLRRQFARCANTFNADMNNIRIGLIDACGTLENQLDITLEKMVEISKLRENMQIIENIGAKLEKKFILDNKYTEHSTVQLGQKWDQLNQLAMSMKLNIEQQIEACNNNGVSEQTIRDFVSMFKHFDKDKDGNLDHDELKACLRALGYDLSSKVNPDESNEGDSRRQSMESESDCSEYDKILNIVDPNRSGHVTLQSFTSFMVTCETENVGSLNDILDAFKALSSTGGDYITEEEIRNNLTQDQADYCIRKLPRYTKKSNESKNGYDYVKFTESLFLS
ncbi:Spectrin alpha chain [Intoshia linei]|uniref:Spectrin alpha chain n=1 Tax=Intoshia linei TaxID=1819745 RepID=A0A177BAU7_9BILA|nr:Spectrin alpha chain [Intoshia linei]